MERLKWVSVKDKLPPFGYPVLLTINDPLTFGNKVEAGRYWNTKFENLYTGEEMEYVKAWMFFPEPYRGK